MSSNKKNTTSPSHGDERNETHAHLYRLAQATAFLRALKTITPPEVVYASPDEIPDDMKLRAAALVTDPADGKIKPSDEDFAVAHLDASQI